MMKIAVSCSTGHVGSKVAELLLDAGSDVRLLARFPEKLRRMVTRGAGVAEGSLDDEAFVIQATRGIDAWLVITPSNLVSPDYRAFQNRCGRAAAEAIRVNRIPHVVNLSSVGAHLSAGGGPINGLCDVEKLLDHVATNIIHLRPGFFFENFLWHLESIKHEGRIYLPVAESTRIPMIATRDIARIAFDRLVDTCWTGRSVRGLHGPTDLSFGEAAAALSEGTDRKIVHVKVPKEKALQNMLELGMSEGYADMMLELYRGFELGTVRPAEERSPETYTPTRLVEFAREVLYPLVAEPVLH